MLHRSQKSRINTVIINKIILNLILSYNLIVSIILGLANYSFIIIVRIPGFSYLWYISIISIMWPSTFITICPSYLVTIPLTGSLFSFLKCLHCYSLDTFKSSPLTSHSLEFSLICHAFWNWYPHKWILDFCVHFIHSLKLSKFSSKFLFLTMTFSKITVSSVFILSIYFYFFCYWHFEHIIQVPFLLTSLVNISALCKNVSLGEWYCNVLLKMMNVNDCIAFRVVKDCWGTEKWVSITEFSLGKRKRNHLSLPVCWLKR